MHIWLVLALTFHVSVAINMTRPIVVLFASDLGTTTFGVGMLVAAYSLFPIFISIHAGKAVDAVDSRSPVLLSALGTAGAMLLPYLYPQTWALYASQVIVGIAHLILIISLQNIVGNSASPEERSRYFGLFATSVSLAAVAGPVSGAYLAQHFSYPVAYLAAVGASLLGAGLSLFLPASKPAASEREPGISASLNLLKQPLIQRALISSALVLYSRDIFIAYFPLYARDLGITVAMIGWILSIQGLSMVLVRALLPKLVTRFELERVLLGSICVAGVAFFLVPFAQSPIVLGLLAAAMGAGLGCGQPLSMVETYNASPKARTGEVLGLRMSANRISQFIAPLFFGIVGGSLGVVSVFLVSGFFLIGGGYLVRSRKKT